MIKGVLNRGAKIVKKLTVPIFQRGHFHIFREISVKRRRAETQRLCDFVDFNIGTLQLGLCIGYYQPLEYLLHRTSGRPFDGGAEVG